MQPPEAVLTRNKENDREFGPCWPKLYKASEYWQIRNTWRNLGNSKIFYATTDLKSVIFYGIEKEIITTISQDIWHIQFLQTFQMTIILHHKIHQPNTVQPRILEIMVNLKVCSTLTVEIFNSSVALLESGMYLEKCGSLHSCDPMEGKKCFP